MKISLINNYVYVAEIEQKEIEKVDFALCKGQYSGGRQTLDQFYDACDKKPSLLINGGYFNMANGETIWAYEDERVPIMDYGAKYHTGIGTVNNKLVCGSWYNFDWTDFVTAYPLLVQNGQPINGTIGWDDANLRGKNRRTALGWNAEKVYIVCAETPGLTLSELQQLFLELGCTFAANLDGGGSTRMLKDGKKVTTTITNRPVDNVVAVYLKEEEKIEKVLYRVQVGAYSKVENARKMLDKVKEVPGCENAYVRKIGNLYKVQCGAFSIYNNATRLLNTLKSYGFNGFITK